ncbi:MAG: permease prefix domain 1-containing protein [Bifidobacteriaceae bacterium]|jgi:hypothetical protein|nr:permease prefix domain 1-containing protein [Bifidobacteriaceae bacterium]
MDPIRIYLDNTFGSYPPTRELARLKSELQADLEEKYAALLAEGKSPDEALGRVVAEFGSADELVAALRDPPQPWTMPPGQVPPPPPGPEPSRPAPGHGSFLSVTAALFWPIILLVYLAWSLLWSSAWGVSWVIWPLAGIAYGGIQAGTRAYANARGAQAPAWANGHD